MKEKIRKVISIPTLPICNMILSLEPKTKPMKWTRKFVKKVMVPYLKTTKAVVDGHELLLDEMDSLWLSIRGIHEPLQTAVLKHIINHDDVAIDLGANIGYYTLIMANMVGNQGRVFAFEPYHDNFQILKTNVQNNGYRNVVLIEKAVSDTNKTIELYINEKNMGAHTLSKTDLNQKYIEVETVILDDILHKNKIDIIKMDIEGAELKALKGMKEILKSNKNIKIVTEFNPYSIQALGDDPKDFLKFLIYSNFHIYEIDERKKQIYPVSISCLLEKYPSSEKRHTNLLCTRKPLDQKLYDKLLGS